MRRFAILTALMLAVSVSAVAQSNGTADNETAGNLTDNDTALQEDTNMSNISSAILTGTLNYPDTVISSPASERTGMPILLTDSGNLSEETAEFMEDSNVEKVFIVGGPAVISTEVESEVDSITENTTTRLWGETQIETSVEVSEFFWTDSSEATVVQQPVDSENGYKLLTPLKSALTESREPLLMSDTGNISSETVTELERLDVNQVEVYSTNASNVTEQLDKIGVNNAEINEGSTEELREQIREETVTEETENVTAIAAPNFTYSLSSANIREPSVLVTADNETETAVDALNRTQDEEIQVIGEPELSENIAQQIENSTNKSTTVTSGEPVETVIELLEEQQEEWNNLLEERFEQWMSEVENSQEIEQLAENAIEEAETAVNEVEATEAQNLLENARNEMEEENYFNARNLAISASSQAQIQAFMDGQLDEIGENETEDTSENQTENQSNNETQGGALNAGDSQINISAADSSIRSSISYTAPTTGYTTESDVETSEESVTFTYNISSPEEVAGQALTEVSAEESAKDLSSGNYTVNVEILVDGEIENQMTEQVELIG